MNATESLASHVHRYNYDDLPQDAVDAAKTFIFDAVAVGISGSRHPRMQQLHEVARKLGAGDDATVWGSGEKLPLASAVMLNAYQVHNQEFDSVHDGCVVHALASIIPAAIGYAERVGGICGKDLITAVTLGLDVSIFIGRAQGAPMRFFRPAMCGALGATAALARLSGLSGEQTMNALGLMYSQLSGTMQAHVEGSPALGLQVGFNARAAVLAMELAAAGFPGPKDVLEGQFGYFALYDFGQSDWNAVRDELGRVFQITRMSHKPFPTGRAAHGGVDGVLSLMASHRFSASDVARVRVYAPPLVVRLVGRPAKVDLDSSYARLCLGYVVATALLNQGVVIEDFDPAALADPHRQALARLVEFVEDGNPDPNALGPQAVEIDLTSGRTLRVELPAILGHPERPLPVAQQNEKFRRCCASIQPALSDRRAWLLASALRSLENLGDVRELIALMTADGDARG